MSSEAEAVVQRFVHEVLGGGKLELLDSLVVPEEVGLASLQLAAMRRSLPDAEVEVLSMLAENDRVVAHLAVRGTHLGELRGIPATGKRICYEAIGFYQLQDGKIHFDGGITDADSIRCQIEPGRKETLLRWWAGRAFAALAGAALATALRGT